jgi:hypothetical protein
MAVTSRAFAFASAQGTARHGIMAIARAAPLPYRGKHGRILPSSFSVGGLRVIVPIHERLA